MTSIKCYTKRYNYLNIEKANTFTFRISIGDKTSTKPNSFEYTQAEAFVSKDELQALCYAIKTCSDIRLYGGCVEVENEYGTDEVVLTMKDVSVCLPKDCTRDELAQMFVEVLKEE